MGLCMSFFLPNVLGLVACTEKATSGLNGRQPTMRNTRADAGLPGDAAAETTDKTAELFRHDKVLRVEVEVSEASWAQVRNGFREFYDILSGEDCMDEPLTVGFPAVEASVTVDGQRFEKVGLSKSSVLGNFEEVRPSLKIEFDYSNSGNTLYGLSTMILNGVSQDRGIIRECLAHDLYRKAGLVSPRCNFAEVFVNGESLGIYSHLEQIDQGFIERNFDGASGSLWRGLASDFREGWTQTFINLDPQNNTTQSSDAILALTNALKTSSSNLVESLNEFIDLDSFLTYWAFESLLGHWSGYAGNRDNFVLFVDDVTNKISFILLEAPTTFSTEHPLRAEPGPKLVLAQGFLANRLYQDSQGRMLYLSKMEQILREYWDEDEILSQINDLEGLIRSQVKREGFGEGIDSVRQFVRDRRDIIRTEIDANRLDWNPELPETVCRGPRAKIDGTVSTTWGTHPTDDGFMTGTGTMNLEFGDVYLPDLAGGGSAGYDENSDTRQSAVFMSVSFIPNVGFPVLFMALPTSSFKDGETVVVDRAQVAGLYFFQPFEGPFTYIGTVSTGTVTIQKASTSTGAEVLLNYAVEVF